MGGRLWDLGWNIVKRGLRSLTETPIQIMDTSPLGEYVTHVLRIVFP
jgi:hypothetical protein